MMKCKKQKGITVCRCVKCKPFKFSKEAIERAEKLELSNKGLPLEPSCPTCGATLPPGHELRSK